MFATISEEIVRTHIEDLHREAEVSRAAGEAHRRAGRGTGPAPGTAHRFAGRVRQVLGTRL